MRLILTILGILLLITACKPATQALASNSLIITSPAFEHNGRIPDKYTCSGEDINPAITIKNIPEATKSIVLIVDDPDAPIGTWTHWIVYNIAPGQPITEDSVPGTQVMNSFNREKYGGPCPPSGTHRYFFKVFALDTTLNFNEIADKKMIVQAMDGHTLARGELIGLYEKR